MRQVRTVTACAIGLAAISLATAACGDRPPRLPSGPPLSVVLAAPERTLAAGRAEVIVADPARSRTAHVDLAAPFDAVEADAVVALDLLRGAIQVDPYGGQGVRGVSTMRYDVSVDFAQAVARTPVDRRAALQRLESRPSTRPAEIAVWIDLEGRARRVQRSLDLVSSPPVTTADGFPAVVTTDYYGFP